MKKYNKPEIEALALETIDVIETSGASAASSALKNEQGGNITAEVETIEQNIATMSTEWQW